MNEQLDPEEVQGLMSRIKAEAIRIVEHHEGTVNQFVGDEIVALFGIPNAHEDDPSRAVKAALELHAMVREMGEEVKPLTGKPLRMHSGINTGLIVTALQDERDGKYGLTGDTVNTGARLIAQANADEILVSPETQRLIAPYFKTESMEPVNMKGKAQPMVPFRILGKTTVQTRIEAAEQRGFTKYTGNLTRKAQSHYYLGQVHMIQGNWEKCIETCRQAVEIAQSIGNVLTSSFGIACLGYARFMLKEQEQGLATLQKSAEMIESSTFYSTYPFFYGVLAFCYAEVGMSKDAMDMVNKSQEATLKGTKEYEWMAHWALAKVAAQEPLSDPQQVDQNMEKGLRIAQERGQRSVIAQGYFHYANILSGDQGGAEEQQKAQEYLNLAIELFHEMKMTWWLEQAKRLGKE